MFYCKHIIHCHPVGAFPKERSHERDPETIAVQLLLAYIVVPNKNGTGSPSPKSSALKGKDLNPFPLDGGRLGWGCAKLILNDYSIYRILKSSVSRRLISSLIRAASSNSKFSAAFNILTSRRLISFIMAFGSWIRSCSRSDRPTSCLSS
jgi:hypothetical protein